MLTVSGVELREDVKLIKKYAYFCLSRFVQNSVLKKANITIKVIQPEELSPKDRKELEVMSAWMFYDGVIGKKRTFTITLSKTVINTRAKKQTTRYKNLLKYLGHELVHVKQYLQNELFDYADGQTARYRGGKYKATGDIDESYWEAPYEIEAYGRQEGLYQMFLMKLKEEKKA